MAIVLFVVNADATPTPCLPGCQPGSEPATPQLPSVIAGIERTILLNDMTVKAEFDVEAVVEYCWPIQYSPAVSVVTSGTRTYLRPVQNDESAALFDDEFHADVPPVLFVTHDTFMDCDVDE